MKAITEYTEEEYEKMREKFHDLLNAIRGIDRTELLTFTRRGGYAHYTFKGAYTDKLVEALGRHPTEDEVIMLVDSGFSHFGAGCHINLQTKTFSGRVNID